MTPGEKELVALTEKWKDQITAITTRYEKAIAKLEKTRTDIRITAWKWLSILMPLVTPLLILLATWFVLSKSPCNTVIKTPNGVEISRICPQK